MSDLFRLIGWTVVDLFRSRAALEAEIWTIAAANKRSAADCWASRSNWTAANPFTYLDDLRVPLDRHRVAFREERSDVLVFLSGRLSIT